MEGKKVLLVDTDPQGSLTISMGWQQPDELPTTLSTLMQKAMNDQPIQPGEGVLHHAEGIDLIPANIELAGLEVALVNSMNREKMLKQVLDSAKREYDFILLDCIKHIVTQASIDGKKVLVQADRAKTKSSLRTLPLVPPIRDRLLMLKGQQDTYRRLCGKSYNREYLGYLCVDEIGNIIRPNYVSEQFPKLLEKNGLRPIRFHDLRHSCASLLLANGVPMKQIQEWLGHSDFSTTANIYAHLDYASKLSSAQAMLEGLGYGNASA